MGRGQSRSAAIATNQASRSRASAPRRPASSLYFARPHSVLIQRWIDRSAALSWVGGLGEVIAMGLGFGGSISLAGVRLAEVLPWMLQDLPHESCESVTMGWLRRVPGLWDLRRLLLSIGLGLLLLLGALLPGLQAGRAAARAGEAALRDLVVLAYHEISEPAGAVIPDYAVTPADFQQQISWLAGHGYHFVSIDQVLAARAGRAPLPSLPVLVSFDDGYRSVYEQAFPLLKRYRVPAVLGLVGAWLEPDGGSIVFGDQTIPRDRLLSWAQIRTMVASGLVEVGSHTYDLHHGIAGNPQGNSEPAVTTRLFTPGRGYESEEHYRRRLRDDLRRNTSVLSRHTGQAPRVVVWPYGRYNQTAASVAAAEGLPLGLTLDDGANGADVPLTSLRRVLMTSELGGSAGLQQELEVRHRNGDDTLRAAKVMHVDLDNIHDPDPKETERNLRLLLDRIRAMGVNTVYLQAYADPDGNGAADALYFPNRHLPMRADLFNHVAWEIRTRTPVRRLYAWMPALAFELPAAQVAAADRVLTQPSPRTGHVAMGYPRLSPFSARAMQTVADIYIDLSRRATFDGLLFHDDVTLSDFEDASPAALRRYRAWGLPTDLARLRADDRLMDRWMKAKTEWLDQLTVHLAALVRENQPQLRTARNLYAQVVLNPHAQAWYSQALESSLAHYDFTAVMAMPYMEQAPDPDHFFARLVEQVREQPEGLRRVLFELQSTDWRTGRDLPSSELADQWQELYRLGARHVGYYPDNLHRRNPDPTVLRPVLERHSSRPLVS